MILDGDRDRLAHYLRFMADQCGLRDWTVGVASDPPDDPEANAKIDAPFGRRFAMIHFPDSWAQRDPDGFRQTIVHELIHCHLWHIDQRKCDLHGVLGDKAYDLYHKAHHEALELAVDGMAMAFADLLPLPNEFDRMAADTPKKRKKKGKKKGKGAS